MSFTNRSSRDVENGLRKWVTMLGLCERHSMSTIAARDPYQVKCAYRSSARRRKVTERLGSVVIVTAAFMHDI